MSVSLDWFCFDEFADCCFIPLHPWLTVVEKLDNEFFNSWLMANLKTQSDINKRNDSIYDAIVKELAMSHLNILFQWK